jgi:hypothetical protein
MDRSPEDKLGLLLFAGNELATNRIHGPSVLGLIDLERKYWLATRTPFYPSEIIIKQRGRKMSKRVYVARDRKYASGLLASRSECGKVVIVLGNGKQLDMTAKEALSVYQFLKADNAD